MLISEKLQDFARFVKEHELEGMIQNYIHLVFSYNIPLLEQVKHLSEEEIYAQSKDGVVQFLEGFEQGNALEKVKENLRLWEADQLPNIPKSAITQLDIFLISTAQKTAFLQLLPKYTKHAEMPTQILVELEEYYKEVQWMALNTLQKMQREQQEQLQESEERYKDLFDNASDLIQLVSAEGHIMYTNNAWKKALGYNKEDLKNLTVYDIVAKDDLEAYRKCREQVLAARGRNGSISVTFFAKNGQQVEVEDFLTAKFRGSKALYSQCIMRNVTERNAAQEKVQEYIQRLEESEESLRQLFENAPDAVIVVDRQMEIISWNPMASKIFGWEKEEILGKSFAEVLMPKRHINQYEDSINQFLKTGEFDGKTSEIVLQDKKRREFYCSVTSSQSFQQDNPIYISFVRDIDQHKKVELELQEQQKNLAEANKELEQYAWLASHDLKEPLRKILTFSDMLVNRHGDNMAEKVKEGLVKINDSAYRMHDMIEAVLSYSSLASSMDEVKLVDLNKIVGDVLSDLEMVVEEKHATVNVNGLTNVEGNPPQLRQLFQNLISNALKYSKPDVAPVINIQGKLSNGKHTITVEDNGIGFDEQYSEKMFQIFKRLVTKDAYKGTGIGLALCQKIVRNHQGTISATSPKDKGAIFKVVLPLYQRG